METDRPTKKQWVILAARSDTMQDDDCACPDHGIVLSTQKKNLQENDCACPDHISGLETRSRYAPDKRSSDCACAEQITNPGVCSTEMDAAPMQAAERLEIPLPGDFWLAYSPYTLQGPGVLNTVARERLQAFVEPQPLTCHLDQALADLGLLQPAHTQISLSTGQPQTFTAWLHVTNACNLDCPYCYVPKSNAQMNVETGQQILRQLFATARAHAFQTVKLKYAGGEPTLNFQLIQQLQPQAVHLAKEAGLDLQAVVLSNGTHLSHSQADWLLENQVRLMISVDGVAEVHDRLRPTVGGGPGAFARLAQTIDQILLPRGLRPTISITITRQNAAGIADAVRWVLERNLPVSLNFYRPNLQSRAHPELALETSAIIAALRTAYVVFEELLPEQPFFNGLLDRVQSGLHTHTCGVGQAYAVFDHTGRVSQCQMQLEQAAVLDPQADLLPVLQQGSIQNLAVDQKAGCAACLFRYLCTGGCPLETRRATGEWDARNPNCEIYQTLLPEALRLEGLRLLKVNGYLQ